jgi:hypothetical protein
VGLLLSHKRTVLSVYADMVTVSEMHESAPGGGKRGEIEAMSKGSRMRLLKLMHKLEYKSVTMVTLTYPAKFTKSGRKTKAHLKAFRRKFESKWGKVKALWRLEFQSRGAPHYHIIYLDCPFIPIGEVSRIWYDIVKSKDENHLKNGVDLKRIHDASQQKLIMHYVSKYIAKVQKDVTYGEFTEIGRWWGRWNITEPVPITIVVRSGEGDDFVDNVLRSRGDSASWEPTDRHNCTIFGGGMGGDGFMRMCIRLARNVAKPES